MRLEVTPELLMSLLGSTIRWITEGSGIFNSQDMLNLKLQYLTLIFERNHFEESFNKTYTIYFVRC